MIEKPKPHFAKLGSDEIHDLLELVVKQQADIYIWQKKGDFQETARAEDFDLTQNSLTIKGFGLTKLDDSEVLLNFRFANRMYFSTADIKFVDDKTILTLPSNIFKCEQRCNFRLPSNITRQIKITLDGQIFNANDVSVSGIGIIASLEEATQFKINSGYDNTLLQIGDRQFNIPFCKIVHIRDYFTDKKTRLIGLEFIEVSRPLEVELYKTINNLLYIELKK